MRLDHQLLSDIRSTVQSGYYERHCPVRCEKRSLAESIERANASASLALVLEISTAVPGQGQMCSSRLQTSALIDELSKSSPAALGLWVEPKHHAGDLRWLSKESPVPVLCKDWIIDARQIVGGDAVLLCLPLIRFAGADIHQLIEAAHEQDMEAVLEVFSSEQLIEAKETEADIICINNHGPNGGTVDVNTTVQMLCACKTGRPVISSQGISDPAQVRTLISSGASALELDAKQMCGPLALEQIQTLRRAVLGKDPVLASVPEIAKKPN